MRLSMQRKGGKKQQQQDLLWIFLHAYKKVNKKINNVVELQVENYSGRLEILDKALLSRFNNKVLS